MKLSKKELIDLLDWRLADLTQTTDDLVFHSITIDSHEVLEKYKKLRRLEDLHVKSIKEGVCTNEGDLDWKEMHHRGWLSKHDYTTTFKEELQGLDPKKWKER